MSAKKKKKKMSSQLMEMHLLILNHKISTRSSMNLVLTSKKQKELKIKSKWDQ
jgi:hypothetical protein